ncbi:hypothetical protein [Iningainema tapete]|uniref:Uncharacterized protein n=1 Tax=Iningainema tapete BLCC-T55 TaxID=2748662 RepID=A0A8J6XRQ4_9CYAN|nr:hypothetical protein [Iningainema tapete]MBD2775372.1 hypothetical protein [Iningainema tapete BLCC-T55]
MFLKNRALTTIFAATFALGFVSVGTSAQARDPKPGLSCTNSSLQGSYGTQSSGFLNSGATPFNLAFLNQFDGNGNITGVNGSTSAGGEISQNRTNTGTYQVNSDCTVTINFDRADGTQSTNFGVIVNNGRKILYISTDQGSNISGTIEKVGY